MVGFLRKRKREALWPWVLLPLLLALAAAFVWSRLMADTPPAVADPAEAATVNSDQESKESAKGPTAPPPLASEIKILGGSFDGDVGIVVQSIDDGWIAEFQGSSILPQQSLSKLWVAATVMDQADQGDLSLSDGITLTAADLSIFHQPIRKKILARGVYRTSIAELLRYAMTQSDNTANAVLFRAVGGRPGVMRFLTEKKLGAINMAESEKILQMGIVGMKWQEGYSYGRNFWRARKKVPLAQRTAMMGTYLAAPPDGATPLAIADGLSRLAADQLLSPAASDYLIDLMAQSKTGPKRLRGGMSEENLVEGWSLPHKTGTGQVLKLLATAYNDVGILISPSGRRYAVVVMIGATNRPVPERQELMQAVTRAVIACEEGRAKGCV